MARRSEQLSLFESPAPAPVVRARAPRPGTGPVVYAAHNPRHRLPCEDCAQLVYDGLRAGQIPGTAIAQARFKRTQAGQSRLLCAAHANQHKQDEAASAARPDQPHPNGRTPS